MGYQALLFCPDEKLARVVSQVFGELDFSLESVHEPFAAVKKLMAQRFDAIVVDCENEQNASLLFKSARNSSSNQSSLAIALVEGQAGVAKAYRIGANLVLTKPINVEQAKGTLRVARGLLRKNSDAAGASATSAAAPAMPAKAAPVATGSSFQPASRAAAAIPPLPTRTEFTKFEAPGPAPIPEEFAAAFPAMAASARVEDRSTVVPALAAQGKMPTQTTIAAESAMEAWPPASSGAVNNDVIKNDAVRIVPASKTAQNPNSVLASAAGSAAAPAPAREVTAAPAKENAKVELEPSSPSDANPSHASPSHDAAPIPMFSSVSAVDAPSFGALGESGASGRGRKILIAAAVVLALAALGYLGYGKLGKFITAPALHPVSTSQNSGQPTPDLASTSSPAASTNAPERAKSTTQTSALTTAAAAPIDNPSAANGNSSVIRMATNSAASPEPETKKPDSAPLVVKSNAAQAKTQVQAEESETSIPSPLGVASGNESNLSGLMSAASSSVAKPLLATVRISQGVSQGLLIKRVQPKYPSSALAIHATGAVEIEATINKEGSVTNLKVLSGDAVFVRAAVEAVRQWRYKPYYLDGQPVEIQTQITVHFKAN